MAKSATKQTATNALLPFQERVVSERDSRTEEVEKLDEFISSEAFAVLDEKNQALLQRQSDIMHQLVGVLNARIAIFEVKGNA